MNIRGIINSIKSEMKAKQTGAQEIRAGADIKDIKKKYRTDSAVYKGAREEITKEKAQEAYYKEKERLKIKEAKERAKGGNFKRLLKKARPTGLRGVGSTTGSTGIQMGVRPVFTEGMRSKQEPKKKKFVFQL